MKFFKLEDENEFYKKNLKDFYGNLIDIENKRSLNYKEGKLLNHGFPIVQEEVKKIKKLFNDGLDLFDLENYFQRSRITIKNILHNKYKLKTETIKNNLNSNIELDIKNKLSNQVINLSVDMSKLSERDVMIFKLRFGIGLKKKMSLKQIAELYGISKERVRQIEKKIIEKLKFDYYNDNLENNYSKIKTNTWRHWTEIDDNELEKMYCEKRPINEISDLLKRTRGAIKSRIKKLQLVEKYGRNY